jgi:hypothetical protein
MSQIYDAIQFEDRIPPAIPQRSRASSAASSNGRLGNLDSRPRRSSPLVSQPISPFNAPDEYLLDGGKSLFLPDRYLLTYIETHPAFRNAQDTNRRETVEPEFLHEFNPQQQGRKLWTRGVLRLLSTTILLTILLCNIHFFSRMRIFDSSYKHYINVVTIGISLLLGMSLLHSFRSMARNIRWFILTRALRPVSEVSTKWPLILFMCLP